MAANKFVLKGSGVEVDCWFSAFCSPPPQAAKRTANPAAMDVTRIAALPPKQWMDFVNEFTKIYNAG